MTDDPTAVSVDIEQAESSSHGHRQLDDIWDHYKKIRLTTEEHDKWHRWYDALVTDNASNMVKTRRLVLQRFPHLVEVRSVLTLMLHLSKSSHLLGRL